MQHIPEILKIIEGGLANNARQVISYADMLATKLDNAGESDSANFIRGQLKSPKNLYSKTDANYMALPVDKDSRLDLGDITAPPDEPAWIKLPQSIEFKVEEFLNFINHEHLLVEAGVGISPSLLLYGPPGCGKTLLANHVAASLKLPLITARCDTLISSYLGSTAKNLRSLFDHAASRPCVLFLDEFDAFAKARDDQFELGELKRVVVSLLQNIDSLPEGTVLIAATNHEQLLDPAIWRRFAYKISLPLPSEGIRLALLEKFLRGWTNQCLTPVVDATDGMNGAEIEHACKSAIRQAIVRGETAIDLDLLLFRLVEIKYKDVLQDEALSPEEKVTQLRLANSKLFTIARLESWFSMSKGKISKLTSKRKVEHVE